MPGDILFNPMLGFVVVIAQPLELGVWNPEHDLNASAGEGLDGPVVGIEELDLVDAVVLEQLHHDARREVVGGL